MSRQYATSTRTRLNAAWWKAGMLGAALVLCTNHAQAQITVPGTHASLAAAFTDINNGVFIGAVTINITASYAEPAGSAVLNSSGAESANYTSVTIRPSADGVVITGTTVAGRGVIELNGADNVTINGDNPNTAGTNRDLTITNAAINTTTFTSVIRAATSTLITSANAISVSNCIINGSATGRNVAGITGTAASENTTYGIILSAGASTAAATTAPSALASLTTVMAAGQTANGFTVDNCQINACAKGIAVNAGALTNVDVLTLTNNVIGDATPANTTTVYTQGITVAGFGSANISGNTIRNIESFVGSSTGTNTIIGIGLGTIPAAGSGIGTNAMVQNNKLSHIFARSTGTWPATGIYVNLSAASNSTFQNNFISDVQRDFTGGTGFSAALNAAGIKLIGGTNFKVYHNTVHMFGTWGGGGNNTSDACLVVAAVGQTNVDVRDNIFSNTVLGGGTGTAHCCVLLPTAGTSAMNYVQNNNAMYCGSGTNQFMAHNGFSFVAGNAFSAANFIPASNAGATNWRTYTSTLSAAGTNDNASFGTTGAAPFVSNTDLHIAGTPAALNGTGVFVGVNTDIDGGYRSNPPEIGAHEFTPAPCAGATGSVSPVQDCANSQFFLSVTITALNGSSTVDVGSDFAGNPGATTGVGVGTYQIGPFPSNANVQVLITSNTSPLCNTSLGTYSFDCSTNGQNALFFDGVNDRVNVPASASLNVTGTGFTVEAWVYPTSFSTAGEHGNSIVNKEGAGGTGFMLRCGNNGQIGFSIGIGTFPVVTAPVGTLVLNQWQHVAGIYDGVNMRIYKNGVQVGSGAQTAPMISSAAATMAIGNWINGNDRPFAGMIDEVRIWGVARTVPQLNTTMNNVLCGTETELRAYYQFNQGTAGGNNVGITNVPDLTVNANNGTAVNMALTGPTSNWVVGRTGLAACLACTQPTATAVVSQDCANSQFFINVNVSNLNGGPNVNVVSNYSGNPGAQFGVGTGTYPLGPFPSNTNVQVTVQHTGDAACNLALGSFTYDCATFGQNALSFDGVNDRVNCGTGASLNITGTQVSLEAWIYPTAFKANPFEGSIINKEGPNVGYMLRCGGSGVLSFALGNGTTIPELLSPTGTLTLNTWQHVAATYDGTTMRIFKNGVQVGSLANALGIATTPNQMMLGDYTVTPGTRNFAGKIDEPRVWSVARSAGDIASFVNQQLCGNEPGLAAYYHFDQGLADGNNAAVTTAIDASVNGNTGTLFGFALNGTTSNWVLGKTGMGVCAACAGTPTAGAITGNGSSCLAASNLLTLTGATFGLGITYQWKYGPVGGPYTNLLGTSLTQNTSGIPLGTYEMVVDVTCNAGPTTVTTVAFPFSVNPVPTASASAGPGCLGQTLNLTGTTNIGTSFAWTGPNSFVSAAQNPSIPTITAAAAGTYSFTATAAGCSSAPGTVIVAVNTSPILGTVSATPSTICNGASSQLSASATTSGYFLSSGGATWTDIAGTGTSVGVLGDDTEHNLTIPSFVFNGITYTTGRVGTNGVLVLGSSAGEVSLTNTALPSAGNSAGNVFLAPWWDDLDIQGGATIVTQTVGNRFIVQFNNMANNFATGGVDNVYFQIQMDLVTGGVYFVYFDVFWGNATYDQALAGTVGIQWANAAGSFIQYSFNTASLTDGQVIAFLPNSPNFSWSPVTFLDNPLISNPLASGVTATTTYTVTATAANGCAVQGMTTVTMVPVDDNDPCTVDGCVNGVATHTYTDTDNDGTCDGLDGCPLDANKIAPGICGCGVADTDTDGDGTANCNDGCPLDPNKTAPGICGCGVADADTDNDGTADCNDGCPTDPNKIAPGLCGCFNLEGTCNDCEGVLAGPAQPGTSCEDNNACTINDVWSPSCVCAGTFQDTDGDGACDADDICPGANDFLDTDGDGVVDCLDNCPLIGGQMGTACDDGNPNTLGDLLDANCVCAGTIPPCPNNLTVLSLTTDNDATQTTWDVIPLGGGAPLCSGAGFANNTTFGYNCCLPDGCYELRVFDSAGDGIANGSIGGYTLTQSAGNKRIIDNSGDGIFTSLSQVANNLGFCVPLGNDALVAVYCDKGDWLPNDVIQANANSAVTSQFGVNNSNSGYQFWFFNPDGGYSRRVTQTHAAPGPVSGPPANVRASYLRLSSLITQPIPFYTNLNVRVRTQVAGVFSEFGPACRFRLDPPCSTTQLTSLADPVVSCGATGLTLGSTIYATAVNGATTYQFEFSKPGYLRRIGLTVRSVALSYVTNPLQNNNCYNVRVRVSFDGAQTYCPFGPYCSVTIGTALCSPPGMILDSDPETGVAEEIRLNLWPNPNDGTVVNLTLTEFDVNVNTVGVDVTDAFGKLITTRTIPVQDGYLNTALSFEQDLAPGLYLVNLTVGEKRYTERLVIQR